MSSSVAACQKSRAASFELMTRPGTTERITIWNASLATITTGDIGLPVANPQDALLAFLDHQVIWALNDLREATLEQQRVEPEAHHSRRK
jgi:hypothetical protein